MNKVWDWIVGLFTRRTSIKVPAGEKPLVAFVGLRWFHEIATTAESPIVSVGAVTVATPGGRKEPLTPCWDTTLGSWGISYEPLEAGVHKIGFNVARPDGSVQKRWLYLDVEAAPKRVTLGHPITEIGVNMHWKAYYYADWDRVARYADWVRIDGSWAGMEQKPGVFDWGQKGIEIRKAREKGIKVLIVLDYGNPLYGCPPVNGRPGMPDTSTPSSPSWRAWLRYCVAMVREFGTEGMLWEIENEPGNCMKVEAYAALVRSTVAAIKAEFPDAVVLSGGGIGETHFGATDPAGPGASTDDAIELLKTAGGAVGDYISIHPYSHGIPEAPYDWWAKDYKPPLPLIQSEQGWSLELWSWRGCTHQPLVPITEEEQAFLVARQILLSMRMKWPVHIVFQYVDFWAQIPQSWGIFAEDGRERPMGVAVRTLREELKGCTLNTAFATSYDGLECLLFDRPDGGQTAVYWTRLSNSVTMPAAPADTCRTMLGEILSHEGFVEVGPAPVYVRMPAKEIQR